MPAAVIKTKDELISEIKGILSDIAGCDEGRPVNLDNVSFNDHGTISCGGKIYISCLFMNEEGNICADMYRSGSAGFVDFICGQTLELVDDKILKKIISALAENRWSSADYPVSVKRKKRNIAVNFKFPFFQKGA